MTQSVLRDDRDGVAHLTLNRPDKLNALNLDVFQALEAHVKAIAGSAVRAVVLRGAGRCFSAGHDLGDIAAGEKPPRPNYQSHVIEMLADLPMPVISAVHGHCYTGALELALAGDIILAVRVRQIRRHPRQMGADPGLGPQPAPAAPGRNLQGPRNDVHLPHLFGPPGARTWASPMRAWRTANSKLRSRR